MKVPTIAARERVEHFCERFGLTVPILLAPMAGVPAPSLSIAVAQAGGLGACGVLLMMPAEITQWAGEVRRHGTGIYQLNNWIPDPSPVRDAGREAAVRAFLGKWGPEVPAEAGDATPPAFEAQFEAMLAVIVAASMRKPPSAARSGCSPCCPPWLTR